MTDGAAFQRSSVQQGQSFEDLVAGLLTFANWTIDERGARVAGHKVDYVATDPDGTQWLVECKGSYGNRPGCIRRETVCVAIAVAWSIRYAGETRPFMLVTSHLPAAGVAATLLDRARDDGLFAEIVATGPLLKFDHADSEDDE